MSLLSPAPAFHFVRGHPSRLCLRLITTASASARFTAPKPANFRREVRSLCALPRAALPSIEQSRQSTSSFVLYDPVSFLLDGVISLLRVFRFLPSDFCDRWQHIVDITEKDAEAWLARLPFHLIQAVTASEDHRFFSHYGIDLHGIARAVVNYPNGGGGSTITQQLVKRVFLTSERTISRKFIEGLLSLMVEKRISKWKILYSYLKKMYWGNGIYGIESASQFYFGKRPSSLSVGESAMLVGILPGPELLNPLKYPKRSKSSQVKVLRRMVSAGYLEMEKAVQIAREPFYLCSENKFKCAKELINI
ncbi:hypothetical protein KFK09_013259 [Dendrobium nobile]|uniref:Glycosyl transferase family 51 domain-containing protein n=1 Tax=Dendrobium nobile TaxID=94219 RepID=A0A8T3B8F6_DENNO|nr:hypothetical protein KFK09_013259 [Dendrobium nobile]